MLSLMHFKEKESDLCTSTLCTNTSRHVVIFVLQEMNQLKNASRFSSTTMPALIAHVDS